MEALLGERFLFVDSPEDADIEFYVGQPPMNLYPAMQPNVVLSMFETNTLPESWANSFNNWDTIINPSTWGKGCFINSGVIVPIEVIPLPIDFDKFKLYNRTLSDDTIWTYISQGVQLADRKNITLVAEAFESGMPEDTHLILKTIPKSGQPELDLMILPQVRLLQKSLDFDEYYDLLTSAHVSVNPSAGEGFAYLVGESMATGMCTLMTKYSAMLDLLNNHCTLGIDCTETFTKVFVTGGKDAAINTDSLKEQMLWTYNNKKEALEMGVESSKWIRRHCDNSIILDTIEDVLSKTCTSVNKKVFPSLPIEELVDMKALMVGRR